MSSAAYNYVTLLSESGAVPLIAMKTVGHSDYRMTADICTRIRDGMLKKSTINMAEIFREREGPEQTQKAACFRTN